MHRRGARVRVGRIAEWKDKIGWARAGKFAEWNYMGAMGKFSYTLVEREEEEIQWNSLISTDDKGSQFCPPKKAKFAKKMSICTKRPRWTPHMMAEIMTLLPSLIMTSSLCWLPPGFELGSLAPKTSVLSIVPRCHSSINVISFHFSINEYY